MSFVLLSMLYWCACFFWLKHIYGGIDAMRDEFLAVRQSSMANHVIAATLAIGITPILAIAVELEALWREIRHEL